MTTTAREAFRKAAETARANGYTQPMMVELRIADVYAIEEMLSNDDETTYLLRSPANAEHLRRSIEEANMGKFVAMTDEKYEAMVAEVDLERVGYLGH